MGCFAIRVKKEKICVRQGKHFRRIFRGGPANHGNQRKEGDMNQREIKTIRGGKKLGRKRGGKGPVSLETKRWGREKSSHTLVRRQIYVHQKE